MGIPLGNVNVSNPSAKLRNKKDYIKGFLVDMEIVPWIEFGTTQPKLGEDGKPRTQERVTLLVAEGTAVVKDGDEEREVLAGELVTLYFSGHRRWDWAQAQKQLPGRRPEVGYLVRVDYTGDEPSKAGSPKKVWKIRIQPAGDGDAANVATCERLYHEQRKGRAQAAPSSAEDYGGAPPHDGGASYPEDDIPFGLLAALGGGLLLKAFEVLHGGLDISAWV